MKEAPELLEQAAATMRERSAERDTDKERAMTRTVAIFNSMFPDKALTEYEGWMFMVALKLARAHGGSYREDDYIDAPAYLALAGECRATTEGRSNEQTLFKPAPSNGIRDTEG
jgi:hypothetical protein